MVRSYLEGLLDLVYPPTCLLCRKQLKTGTVYQGVCARCMEKIPISQTPNCLKCSRPLSIPHSRPLCRNCQTFKPAFDFAWGACPYTETLRQLIHGFKFQQKLYLKHVFLQKITEYIAMKNLDIAQFDLIVPIPLSSTRMRERGYNQSAILAHSIAKHYNIRYNDRILVRPRNSTPQSTLSQKERWTNIRGAFRIKSSITYTNKNILLVDDLLTTGATLSAAAEIFKQETRASRIAALTLAIA